MSTEAQVASTSATDTKAVERMPVLFISHGGGPCFFMDDASNPMFAAMNSKSKAAQWYRDLAKKLHMPKPKAIVLISGHHESRDKIQVTSQLKHPTLLYDYYGFPESTYELKYPAPGNPELAKQIVGLLSKSGFPAEEDKKRNFDHGVFIPLKLVYPEADIPIVQVSMLSSLDAKTHIKLGEALAPLRDQGVLIIGSGSATHDLRFRTTESQAKAFVKALDGALSLTGDDRVQKLTKWNELPHAKTVHPREEHLIPLHVAVGAAGGSAKAEQINDIWAGALSLASWQFK